jgi:type I restriction enzyme S subunit
MRKVTLKNIATIQSGFGFPTRFQGKSHGDFPFAKVGEISRVARQGNIFIDDAENWITKSVASQLKVKPFPKNTIVFAKIGEAIKQNFKAITNQSMLFDNNVMGIIPNEEIIDIQYLFFFLKTIDFYRLVSKTTLPSIRKSTIESLEIPLPPIAEQKRIAAILDKADAVRRKRREAIRLTEELLRSTFLEMFGDLATNSRGWDIVQMSQILEETQYGTSQKSNDNGQGLPVLRMNNITYKGTIDLSDIKHCEISEKDERKYVVSRGDLLFNRTNSPELVGKTAVWHSEDVYAFAGYLIRVRFQPGIANSDYVSAFLNSDYGKKYIQQKAKPSINMSNFSASDFKKIPISLPPIGLQNQFSQIVQSTMKVQKILTTVSKQDESLFNSLLQRACTGGL